MNTRAFDIDTERQRFVTWFKNEFGTYPRPVDDVHLRIWLGAKNAVPVPVTVHAGDDVADEQCWISVATVLPDADTTVLIALNDDDVWIGYLDGGVWRYVDGMPIASERVTHWRHLPAGPHEVAHLPPAPNDGGADAAAPAGAIERRRELAHAALPIDAECALEHAAVALDKAGVQDAHAHVTGVLRQHLPALTQAAADDDGRAA